MAQNTPKVLTFDEAVRTALRNGVLLNQQKNNLEVSQMQKLSSIASIGPNVSINSSAGRRDGNSFNQQQGKVINGILDNASGSLSANINIFSGFNRVNSIRQYSNLLDAQSYYVGRTAQDLINTVATQYLQVLLDVELMLIAKESFNAQDKQYQQIQEQVSLGARSPVDEYNQDALRKAAELRYVQAEITLNNDKTTLTQTLLIDPFEIYEVEKPSWSIATIGGETLNMEDLADKAKSYRGDYLRAVKTEQAQKFGMKALKGLMMPSLYAYGNYGTAYNYQYGVPDSILQKSPSINRPWEKQLKEDNVYKSYGLQFTIPLFNGFQSRTLYVQQKALYDNAVITRMNLEYQIKNDVIRAVRNYDGAKKAFSITMDQLKSAEMAMTLETERYNLGVTNFVDYANAYRALVQAQTDKAQAEYKLLFQKVLVDYAVGTLKPEDFQ